MSTVRSASTHPGMDGGAHWDPPCDTHICAYKCHKHEFLMMHNLQLSRGYAVNRRDMHLKYFSVALMAILPVLTQGSGQRSVTVVANALFSS